MGQKNTRIREDRSVNDTSTGSDDFKLLAQYGCPDLTSAIDPSATSEFPVSSGGFGDVYKGTLRDGTGVALKVYRTYEAHEREKINGGNPLEQRMARELYVLSRLRHPNVLPLMGVACFRGRLSMVTEWMGNGSLIAFVLHNPEANRFELGMGVCAGLCYLHDSGVVHGDLKAANVLVSSEGAAMIADLDNSVLVGLMSTEQTFNTPTGPNLSLRWAAPEMLMSESDSVSKTRATDVYAYGMTLLEIITGEVPWSGKRDQAILFALASHRVPERPSVRLDDVSWALLLSCWAPSPDDRPTIREIQTRLQAVLHDWESSLDKRGSNPWDFLDPSEQVKAPTQAPDDENYHVIGTSTPTEVITAMLVKNGCTDLTDAIDHNLCGQNPYTAGGFGDIYRGALKSGATVAIKILLLRTDSAEINVQGKIQKRTARELCHWARLKHPNVLPLTGFALFRDQVSMVSEWMQGGSVVSYLEFNPNANRIQLCVDVHGDLKAANVMVSAAGAAMIGDFGNADLEELQSNFTRTVQRPGVSIRWASPELLLQENARPNNESDVYACGMTILETVTGDFPFKGQSMLDVMFIHRSGGMHPRPPGMNDRLWDLVVACWDRDVDQRASIETTMARLEPLVAYAGAICSALREQDVVSESSNKVPSAKSKQTDPGFSEESDYITRPPGATMSYFEYYTCSLPVSEMNAVYYTAPLDQGSLGGKTNGEGGDDKRKKHG